MKNTINSLIFLFTLLSFGASAQLFGDKKIEKTIIKTGPYFGVQSGLFYAGEVGMERQWKQGKLISPTTNSFHFGVNYSYDFKSWKPILGYDMGYWFRKDNISLTYGITACVRTNFEQYRYGFSPVIGYKVWQIHLQTGYHFLFPMRHSADNYFQANTIFLSARFILVNDREVQKKEKKKNNN